jgi:hypothetical protein
MEQGLDIGSHINARFSRRSERRRAAVGWNRKFDERMASSC